MEDSILSEWFELLKYETVGSDPARLKECVACASWLRKWLSKLGFSSEMLYPGDGATTSAEALPPPVLFAERKGEEGAPTVLIYGHYDVQPPDPIEEWTRASTSRSSNRSSSAWSDPTGWGSPL